MICEGWLTCHYRRVNLDTRAYPKLHQQTTHLYTRYARFVDRRESEPAKIVNGCDTTVFDFTSIAAARMRLRAIVGSEVPAGRVGAPERKRGWRPRTDAREPGL